MIFDWKKYLYLADNLYENCSTFPNKEACLRAAISRGYYAAFCTARNLARDNDGLILKNTGRDHGIVKDFYLNGSNRNKQKIGTFLRKLKDLRSEADYVDNIVDLISTTEAALTYAHKVIDLLQDTYNF